MSGRAPRSVATQLLVWQLAIALLVMLVAVVFTWWDARGDVRDDAERETADTAIAVAASPEVVDALASPDPSAILQPYAEQVRRGTDTDFVVVMNTDGIRYSHPNPALIGQTYLGHIDRALAGEVDSEEFTGTLGPSVRTVAPVESGGEIVGLVSVGIRVDRVDSAVLDRLPRILGVGAGLGLLGAAGAWIVNRRLRRMTHGLGEAEIARMYEYYDAVLRAVREGLVLVDVDGRVELANDEARRLLGFEGDPQGRTLTEVGLSADIAEAVGAGASSTDDVHLAGERVLMVSHAPARWDGEVVGAVVSLRDRTDLVTVTAELDSSRSIAAALHAQQHEASNRLHTIVSLIEIGRPEAAIEVAVGELESSRQLTEQVFDTIDDEVLAALLLGKSADAAERGIDFRVLDTSEVAGLPISQGEMITVVGNLVDNAFDALLGRADPRVDLDVQATPDLLHVVVSDNGPGVPPALADRVFQRGWSSKDDAGGGHGIGLALVAQVARRRGGTASVGRSATLGGAEFVVQIRRSDG